MGGVNSRSRVNSRRYVALALILALALAGAAYMIPQIFNQPGVSGGSGAGSSSPQNNGSPPSLMGLRSFSSYEELVALLSAQEALEVPPPPVAIAVPTAVPGAIAVPLGSPSGGAEARAFSTTNVQVRGVDELDVVKTDGRLIVVSSYNRVYIVGAAEKRVLSSINISSTSLGVFLWGDTLAILASEGPAIYAAVNRAIALPIALQLNTTIYIYSLSDPSHPSLRERVSYSGGLLGARMVNSTIYMVLSAPASPSTIPTVNGAPLRPSQIFLVDRTPRIFTTIASIDIASGERYEVSLLMSPSSWIYMTPSRLYIASYESWYTGAMEEALKALAKELPSSVGSKVLEELGRGNIGGAYRAARDYISGLRAEEALQLISNASRRLSGLVIQESTRIHALGLRGVNISYIGSIAIPGHILDQFSIEEYRGYLVVATTATNMTPKINAHPLVSIVGPLPPKPEGEQGTVVIRVSECVGGTCAERSITIRQPVQPRGGGVGFSVDLVPAGETYNNVYIISVPEMRLAGSLEGLARGERIYAARLVGDIFYLVTFRQVDPLYAIDLSSPGKPSVLGYIKTPGFSEYLHPLGGGLLLGIGLEERSLKVSIFNTSDPGDIRELAYIKIEGATSPALWDHHAVTIYPEKGLLLIPIAITSTPGNAAGIAAISYGPQSLKLLKILEHPSAIRSIYIEDTVYTVSHDRVNLYDAATLDKRAEIPLG